LGRESGSAHSGKCSQTAAWPDEAKAEFGKCYDEGKWRAAALAGLVRAGLAAAVRKVMMAGGKSGRGCTGQDNGCAAEPIEE
jgi:hypothetical protein